MRTVMHGWLALTMATGIALAGSGGGRAGGLLLDDFGREDDRSLFGTRWRSFTDSVMGGVSESTVTREEIDGRRCLRLRGTVSLENGGGFIQVALPLDRGGRPLDASPYGGVSLVVRTNGEPGYWVHLRTAGAIHPWEHYRAELPAGKDWTEVRIPFSEFRPVGLVEALDAGALTRVGIVAGRRSFEADIAVARVSLYPSPSLVGRGPATPGSKRL